VRHSWYDPIGWAELDLEPPRAEVDETLTLRIAGLRAEASAASARAEEIRRELPQLALELQALADIGSLKDLRRRRARSIEELESELERTAAREEELRAAVVACQRLQQRRLEGHRADPRDHIRRYKPPEPAQTFKESRVDELWAAASIGVLLLLGAALIAVGAPWFTAVLLLVAGSILVDNILRGTVIRFLLNTTIVLAVLASGVLVYEFFSWLVLAALAAAGIRILASNLRELRSH
jgi:hypothetical protein